MMPGPLSALVPVAAEAAPGPASAASTAISAMIGAPLFPEVFLAISPSLSRTAVDERTLCRLSGPCLPRPGEAAVKFTRSSDEHGTQAVARKSAFGAGRKERP